MKLLTSGPHCAVAKLTQRFLRAFEHPVMARAGRAYRRITNDPVQSIVIGKLLFAAVVSSLETNSVVRLFVEGWIPRLVLTRQLARVLLSRRLRTFKPTASTEVVMLVVSALRHDPRVERAARALVVAGFKVTIVAPDISDPPHRDVPLDWGPNINFDLLPPPTSSYVNTRPWLFGREIFRSAVQHEPFAFHAHDLNTALIVLKAAYARGVPSVVDFHEWHSENVRWEADLQRWVPHPAEARRLFKWAERLVARRATKIITVNQSIAQAFEDEAELCRGSVAVIRNVPPLDAVPTRAYRGLKDELGIRADQFVVLYQGGIGPTRCLEPAIRALAYVPRATLVIRGSGLDHFGSVYRAIAKSIGALDRLVLANPVPSRDVVEAARGADAGLYTVANLSKNQELALPNKIFEYLAASLPLLVCDYPEVKQFAELGVGLTFDPHDPQSIAASINRMLNDPDLIGSMRRAIPNVRRHLDLDNEWAKLPNIYGSLRLTRESRSVGLL